MRERIKFIDATRALGILAIYVGHIPNSEGGLCLPFVWSFHVPLFFFISGCTERLAKERSMASYTLSKMKSLLIPWMVFGFLSIGIHTLLTGATVSEIVFWLKIFVNGCIRNRFLNGTLWFITCLFVVQVLFQVIKKLKIKWLIFSAALALNLFVCNYPGNVIPSKPYNIDSALMYMIYYAIGYLCFPYLKRYLQPETSHDRLFGVIGYAVTIGYTVLYYLGIDLVAPLYSIRYAGQFAGIFSVTVIIMAVVSVAKTVDNNSLIQKIGQSTLYLCGAEYIVTTFLDVVCEMFSIKIVLNNSLAGLLYACIKLLLALYLFVPQIKKITNTVFAFGESIIHGFSKNA